jgi:hypothetical protein
LSFKVRRLLESHRVALLLVLGFIAFIPMSSASCPARTGRADT